MSFENDKISEFLAVIWLFCLIFGVNCYSDVMLKCIFEYFIAYMHVYQVNINNTVIIY